jgi:pyruvate dehydrogenase (quinone)
MTTTVSDFLIERLSQWGVTRIFGYPGDGINGVFGALSRAQEKIEFIQARHEEMAAFMASAHAKFTGELGVCIATSGPGASHLITGLYDARMDHMPVLAIVGQQGRAALGGHYQQELDLLSMFKDVAGAFVQQASVPAQVRHLIDRAVRTAIGERRVTALILPNDLQEAPYEEPGRAHGTVHSGVGYSKPKVVPYDADLQRAAEVLNAGEKVAILIGAGALNATDEVIAVAEKLGAGVAKALLGKAALPDDLPWVTGSIGLLGTEPSYKLMMECDTLLMIGSGFPYSEFLPKEGQARGVQIDLQPDMLSLRYPMEVNLVGDAADTLATLAPLLVPKTSRKWRKKVEGWHGAWDKTLTKRALVKADPINPQRAGGGVVGGPGAAGGGYQPQRLGLLRQLVRPRPENPPGHEVFSLRRTGLHGRRRAVCDCGKIRLPATYRDCPGGRRGDADEQHGRADHRRQILAAVGQPEMDLRRVQQ